MPARRFQLNFVTEEACQQYLAACRCRMVSSVPPLAVEIVAVYELVKLRHEDQAQAYGYKIWGCRGSFQA